GKLTAVKPPWSLVVRVRDKPVAGFVTVTVAPGTSSPAGFLTVPTICPVLACDCARATSAQVEMTSREAKENRRDLHWTGELLKEISIVETKLRASRRAQS